MNELDVSTVGAKLRTRRQELGMTVAELAEKTRIRSAFLEDLEADRFDGFPGEAYLLGFFKTYAEALGLESKGMLDQFRRQVGKPAARTETPSLPREMPVVRHRRRSKPLNPLLLTVVCGGLLVGLGYFTWYYWPFHEKTPPPVESLPAPAAVPMVTPPVGEPSVGAPPTGIAERSAEAVVTAPPLARSEPLPEAAETTVAAASLAPEPGLPEGGGMLRVEALGKVNLEVWVDDLPPQKYALFKDSVISWRVTRLLRLQVDAPERLHVWIDADPLDLRGRSELILGDAGDAAGAGAEP